ncbi:hypothetical protein SAMN05428964_1011339 [Thalassospira xiamenensis]|uniref:Uncharacterized protein n=1 Tax=Thalassospira xiamenensis TaxID=220697 RepID=A0A285RLP2_9PROT|nr:hypothetical protein SAMN05428964_1011339 [Thalassospira xiamenensis]
MGGAEGGGCYGGGGGLISGVLRPLHASAIIEALVHINLIWGVVFFFEGMGVRKFDPRIRL